jgi:hypothetical protein
MLHNVYSNGGSATPQEYQVPPEIPPEVSPQTSEKSRLRLAGTAHKRGWPEQARAFRAVLKMIHSRSPLGVRGGSEKVALEVIEHVHLLDGRSLHLLRFIFAELVKFSTR